MTYYVDTPFKSGRQRGKMGYRTGQCQLVFYSAFKYVNFLAHMYFTDQNNDLYASYEIKL